MIVDDEPINIKVVRKYLASAGYTGFAMSSDSTEVMGMINREDPDVLLLDVVMPKVGGLEILQMLLADERFAQLPVVIFTAAGEIRAQALQLGATDFLTKPINPTELVPRVRNALVVKAYQDHLKNYAAELEREVQKRTAELEESRMEVIHCLARAAEYRDNETGHHIIRVGRYVELIAQELGFDEWTVRLLKQAAPLHDVGKIGIPDSVLLNPGKLEPEEFAIIQKHCGFGKKIFGPMSTGDLSAYTSHTSLGGEIIGNCRAPVLELAAKIATTHHEKWDGTGYPLRLAGEDIPIEGRITAVADVFDALSSQRPYKAAFPLKKCFEIMVQERGKHFDPTVLDAFFARRDEIVKIQIEYADID